MSLAIRHPPTRGGIPHCRALPPHAVPERGDSRALVEDLKTIAVSDAAGKNYTELITNVREVYGQTYQPKLDRLTIVYRSDLTKQASIIDLSTRKIISTKPLPDLGADVN
jgi:hypothetical protein